MLQDRGRKRRLKGEPAHVGAPKLATLIVRSCKHCRSTIGNEYPCPKKDGWNKDGWIDPECPLPDYVEPEPKAKECLSLRSLNLKLKRR